MRCIRVHVKLFATLALYLGVAGACGKSEQAGADTAAAQAAVTTYSCTKAGEWCLTYSGDALVLGDGALKGACGAMSGNFAAGSCSTAKALGSCDIGGGQVKTYVPSESTTADDARSDCALHDGKYTAGTP